MWLFLTIVRKLMQTETSSLSFFSLLAICISPGTATLLPVLMCEYKRQRKIQWGAQFFNVFARQKGLAVCSHARLCTFSSVLLEAWLGLLHGKEETATPVWESQANFSARLRAGDLKAKVASTHLNRPFTQEQPQPTHGSG